MAFTQVVSTALMAIGLATATPPPVQTAPLADVVGFYQGQYQCGDSTIPLRLQIWSGANGLEGRFGFGGAGTPSGSYIVSVNASSGGLNLRPRAWEQQPNGYTMVGADLSGNGTTYSGRITAPGCSSIRVQRVGPAPAADQQRADNGQSSAQPDRREDRRSRPDRREARASTNVTPPAGGTAPAPPPLARPATPAAVIQTTWPVEEPSARFTDAASAPLPTRERPVMYRYPYDAGGTAMLLVYDLSPCDGAFAQGGGYIHRPQNMGMPDRTFGDSLICNGRLVRFNHPTKPLGQIRQLATDGLLADNWNNPVPTNPDFAYVELDSQATFGALIARARSARDATPGPRALEIAHAFALSFRDAHPDAALLIREGYLSGPELRSGGYQVTLDQDGRAETTAAYREYAGEMYTERFVFFVDQEPQCTAAGRGYACTFRLYVDVKVSDFLGDVGTAIRSLVFGEQGQLSNQAEESDRRSQSDERRVGFDWAPFTVTFTKTGDAWRSTALDGVMRAEVLRLNANREAMAERRSEAMSQLLRNVTSTDSMCRSVAAGAAASGQSGMTDSLWYKLSC